MRQHLHSLPARLLPTGSQGLVSTPVTVVSVDTSDWNMEIPPVSKSMTIVVEVASAATAAWKWPLTATADAAALALEIVKYCLLPIFWLM